MKFVVLTLILSALASAQQAGIVARISEHPPLGPEELARLEAKVLAQPSDMDLRVRLLTYYRDFASPASRLQRLKHILYIIENQPENPVAASQLTYIGTATGPYANASDHEIARAAWLGAADANPASPKVHLNAARFLYVEHPEPAEDLLIRFLDRDRTNRAIAANLGFCYAMDILGLTGPLGSFSSRSEADRQRLAARAQTELNASTNALVLTGAGTALPNLFTRTLFARGPNTDQTPFELSSTLKSKARELDPQDPELAGPMPLIREFEEFWRASPMEGQHAATAMRASPSSGIRVGGPVQATKLIDKREPLYPEQARAARIQGVVRLNVVIGTDGAIENATLVAGHPLLVPAALEAVRGYRYHPTLLNGAPVKVVTEVEVPFLLAP